MGHVFSIQEESSLLRLLITGSIFTGFIYTGYKAIMMNVVVIGGPMVISIHSPRLDDKSSFISSSAADSDELDFELEKTANLIKSIKELIAIEPIGRKRQLEASLSRAEMSFHSLFELRTRIDSEVSKSAAIRSSESKVLFASADDDASPYKRQKTDSS